MWERRARLLANVKDLLKRVINAADDGKAHRFSVSVVDNTDTGDFYAKFHFTGTLKAAVAKAVKESDRIHAHYEPYPGPSVSIVLLPARGQRVRLPPEAYEKYLPRKRINPADVRD